MRVELELRNLTRFRIMEYLTEAGGRRRDEFHVIGDRWTATLRPMQPAQVGSVRIPRDLLVIEGDPERVETVHALMRRKTLRGGG